jgi:hypothetical protein
MQRIDNPYKALAPKSKYQWHCYWVFEDREFQKDVDNYINNLEELKVLRSNAKKNDSEKLRLKHGDYLLSERNKICNKYRINSHDFLLFKTRDDKHPLHKMNSVFPTLVDIQVSIIDGNLEIRIKPETRN